MSDILTLLPAALRAVAPNAEIDAWAEALEQPMRSSGLVTARRVAAFLGQVAVESSGFLVLEENLHYTAERLCQVWPTRFVIPTSRLARSCAENPEALANEVYGGRLGNIKPGDGWTFRGRGLIQLTGRANYQAFATAIGRHVDDMPDYLATKDGAAVSACWFWSTHNLTALADAWDISAITRTINGGMEGATERVRLCRAALVALGSTT